MIIVILCMGCVFGIVLWTTEGKPHTSHHTGLFVPPTEITCIVWTPEEGQNIVY